MKITLTDKELEQYARELFKTAVASYADAEDSVVGAFVKNVTQKHTVPLLIGGNSLNGGRFPVKTPHTGPFGVKTPQQQQQRELFDDVLIAQASVAEQRI